MFTPETVQLGSISTHSLTRRLTVEADENLFSDGTFQLTASQGG